MRPIPTDTRRADRSVKVECNQQGRLGMVVLEMLGVKLSEDQLSLWCRAREDCREGTERHRHNAIAALESYSPKGPIGLYAARVPPTPSTRPPDRGRGKGVHFLEATLSPGLVHKGPKHGDTIGQAEAERRWCDPGRDQKSGGGSAACPRPPSQQRAATQPYAREAYPPGNSR